MRMERFYTFVGLFVGGAIILTIATALFFYNIYLKEKGNTVVMFFNGSLEGLNATSPVTYRGVKIGEVKLIEVTENKAKDDVRIPVYAQFFIEKPFLSKENPIQILIRKGFVANITQPNFITGTSSIELIHSDSTTSIESLSYKGYSIFPTRNKVKNRISIDETLETARKTLQNISEFVNSPRMRETINATKAVADSFNRLANNINQQAPDLMILFMKSLMSISSAAHSTENLTDYLSRNPESLLRGKT